MAWLSIAGTNVPASVQVEGDDSKLFYAGVFDGHGNATTSYAHTLVDMIVRLIMRLKVGHSWSPLGLDLSAVYELL